MPAVRAGPLRQKDYRHHQCHKFHDVSFIPHEVTKRQQRFEKLATQISEMLRARALDSEQKRASILCVWYRDTKKTERYKHEYTLNGGWAMGDLQ